MLHCTSIRLCIKLLACFRPRSCNGIDNVNTTYTSTFCSILLPSIDGFSLVPVGWSSWCVHCARDGSSGPAKGTWQSRSQRLTCCGQMMAWPLTGLLLGCPTCQHPRPSFQDMRSPTTHLGSICPLRSILTSDLSSTLGCCLFLTDVSSIPATVVAKEFNVCASSHLLCSASGLATLPPASHSMLSFAFGISFLTLFLLNTTPLNTAAI